MQKRIRARLLLFVFISLFVVLCVKKIEAEAPLNAQPFVLNGAYTNDIWLTENDEKEGHWYRLDVPSDGLLEIRIMSYCSDSLYFELWNADKSARYKFSSCSDYVSAGSESSPTTGAVTKVLSQGTYYFRLYSATGRYKLMGSHTSYGTNDASADSYDSPYAYGLGTLVTGALTETDTEDWYRIIVPNNGEYSLNLMSYCSSSLDYTLYNADLSSYYIKSYVSSANSSSPQSKVETKVLSKGTYYLKVWSATGKYTMSFNQVGKKTLKLSVTAKKGKKKITVKTTPNAKVTVQYNGKKWKNINSGSSGKVTVTYSKKLKKGKKVTVTVKKSGYTTKKKTVKVK